MKRLFKFIPGLLFNVDFNAAVDEAFQDYASLCGDKVTEPTLKRDDLPAEKEIKKTHSITYIYDTHATITEIHVS